MVTGIYLTADGHRNLPDSCGGVAGIYLTAVMAITSVSIIMTVIVLNLHYRGPAKKDVPKWIRKIAFNR